MGDKKRARELGIEIGAGTPGPLNAVTDVSGVSVGCVTLIEGEGPLAVGEGPVRTGVTVIVPRAEEISEHPLFAGCHRLNGNGELTGLEWIRESGLLTSPIGLTNSHSVGVVRDALVRREIEARGGGAGMVCHDFKGGTGTASRAVECGGERFTVGVLVQANHGVRDGFVVNGAPVGAVLGDAEVPVPVLPEDAPPAGAGSIIGVVATDAPLLPTQLDRLAQRAGLGVARLGAYADNYSGDLFLAFSTANAGLPPMNYGSGGPARVPVEMLSLCHIDPLFEAVVEATSEAILNAMLAAETMVGRDGVTVHALDGEALLEVLDRYGRRTAGA